MQHFNRSVYGLIKIQDLINRLLHEAFGGSLVMTDDPEWEKKFLTRENINRGLNQKLVAGELSAQDNRSIDDALRLSDQRT